MPRWIALAPLDALQEGDGFPHIAAAKGTPRGERGAPPLMRMQARARRRDDTVVGRVEEVVWRLWGSLVLSFMHRNSEVPEYDRTAEEETSKTHAIVKNKRDPVISEAVVASTFMQYHWQPRPCGQFTVNWRGLVEPLLFDNIVNLYLGQDQNRFLGSSEKIINTLTRISI